MSRNRRHNIPGHGEELVRRDGKIDEVVGRLLVDPAVRITSLTGPGGVGKTVLAEQVCRDPRVVDAFPGGVWKVTIGEHPNAERIARELYRTLTGRDTRGDGSPLVQLSEAFTPERTLVLFDDVWPPDDVARELIVALPDVVAVLITARGVVISSDTKPVDVDRLSTDEARHLLLGRLADVAPLGVVEAADELIGVLGSWALLVDMAARLLADDLTAAPDALMATFRSLASEFRHDPTMLDQESSRDRSFARMVARALERSVSVIASASPVCRCTRPTPRSVWACLRIRGPADRSRLVRRSRLSSASGSLERCSTPLASGSTTW